MKKNLYNIIAFSVFGFLVYFFLQGIDLNEHYNPYKINSIITWNKTAFWVSFLITGLLIFFTWDVEWGDEPPKTHEEKPIKLKWYDYVIINFIPVFIIFWVSFIFILSFLGYDICKPFYK